MVLAAGASNRLGQPKQLVTFDGRSLLQHAVEKCLPVCPLGVFVVTGAERESVGKMLRGEPVQIVHNKAWRDGLASSIINWNKPSFPLIRKAVLLMLWRSAQAICCRTRSVGFGLGRSSRPGRRQSIWSHLRRAGDFPASSFSDAGGAAR